MNRLNNLFPTDETIDMVKEYIRTKVIPPEIKSAYHFRQKYKHFKLNNDDELLYEISSRKKSKYRTYFNKSF